MTISAISGRHRNKARVTCNLCGRDEEVTCAYHRRSDGAWQPETGQLMRKLVASGWSARGKGHWCPACSVRHGDDSAIDKDTDTSNETGGSAMAAARDKATVSTAKPEGTPREPTQKQRLEIMGALLASYDVDARRYTGSETDKTVALAVGPGIMPGWVAAIREAEFGPAGNEEIEAVRAEIVDLSAQISAICIRLSKAEGRLNSVVTAHDRRVK